MRRTAQKRIASLNQVAGKNAAPKGSFLASKRTGSLGQEATFDLIPNSGHSPGISEHDSQSEGDLEVTTSSSLTIAGNGLIRNPILTPRSRAPTLLMRLNLCQVSGAGTRARIADFKRRGRTCHGESP